MSRAVVVTAYGAPDVLEWREVEPPRPGPGQVSISVRAAGVGPTDLAIRRGNLQGPFPLPDPGILGFEAAGVVDAVGPDVVGTSVGDEVIALLPHLGGYAEHAVTPVWTAKPANVTWSAAAALPASAEAAVGVLRQVGAQPGETVLILGAAGSVGLIAVQLAVAAGIQVLAAARAHDLDLLGELGAIAVELGPDLGDAVRRRTGSVDAVIDAAGVAPDVLAAAVGLAGGPARTITLVGGHGTDLGVRLSAPTPDRAPDALEIAAPLLAAGTLRLRERHDVPMPEAAAAHRALEGGDLRGKVVLTLA